MLSLVQHITSGLDKGTMVLAAAASDTIWDVYFSFHGDITALRGPTFSGELRDALIVVSSLLYAEQRAKERAKRE